MLASMGTHAGRFWSDEDRPLVSDQSTDVDGGALRRTEAWRRAGAIV